jgi:hypothetical protein
MEKALKMLAVKHENVNELMPNAEAWTKIKVFLYFFLFFLMLNYFITLLFKSSHYLFIVKL